MPKLNELIQVLTKLPQKKYSDLIKKVDAERRRAVEREEEQHPPKIGMNRDEFAQWIGRRHFAIDKGLSRILYLPAGAPPKEVRLLEVNELADIPEEARVEAVDFMPDVAGLDYSLFVADVTPRQFEAIRSGQLSLPKGWKLKGSQEIRPGEQ